MLLDDPRRRSGTRAGAHDRHRLCAPPDRRDDSHRDGVVTDGRHEVRRLHEHPGARLHVDGAARTERAPAGVSAAPAPGHPGGAPDATGQPGPPSSVRHCPAAVVIGGPPPRLVAHPGPPRGGPHPAAVPVRLPAGAHLHRLPDPAVLGGVHPAAVAIEARAEVVHRGTGGGAIVLGPPLRAVAVVLPAVVVFLRAVLVGGRGRLPVRILGAVAIARIAGRGRVGLPAVLVVAGPLPVVPVLRACRERHQEKQGQELAEHVDLLPSWTFRGRACSQPPPIGRRCASEPLYGGNPAAPISLRKWAPRESCSG